MSRLTLSSLVFMIILVIGMFTGMYLYVIGNANNAGVTISSNYSNVYGNISSESSSIKTTIDKITSNVRNISEADSAYSVAINGFKGLGNIIKLPLSFLDDTISLYEGLLTFLPVPDWVKTLISIGIVAGVIFLIIALLKGEQDKM